MAIYEIQERNNKFNVEKRNKNDIGVKVSKNFNSFADAEKHARKIMDNNTDVLLNDIPF